MFCDYCFLSIFDASINFMRCFPLIIKRIKREKKWKKKTKTLNPWIDLENLKVLFLRNSKNLTFYVTALTEYVYLMFSRICL